MKLSITIMFALSIIFSGYCVKNKDVPPEVVAAAEKGLPEYMQAVRPIPGRDLLGFSYEDSLQNVVLGEPFKVLNICTSNERFKKGSSCNELSKQVSLTDIIWYFPILLDGKMKSLLKIGKIKKRNNWEAFGIGLETIAKELLIIRKNWPLEKGYNPYIIKFPYMGKYYFTVPEVDEYNLTQIIRDNTVPNENRIRDILNQADSLVNTNKNNNSDKYTKLNKIDDFIDTINTLIEKMNIRK